MASYVSSFPSFASTFPGNLRIGETTGSSGKVIQTGGDIRTVETFVAGSNVGDGKTAAPMV